MVYSQGITKRVREVEKKLDEVQKEVKSNTKEIERVDKNIEELRKDMDKMKGKNADEAATFLTADTQECQHIFEAAGVPAADREIKTCRRIGEKGPEPRPMVVVMRREAARMAVLEAARQLRNTNYNKISIVPDLTPAQRKEELEMSEEAERRNREELSNDDVPKNLKWLVVGPRGARRLIKSQARTGWEERGRGRGRGHGRVSGQAARGVARGAARGGVPAVPQPEGQRPALGVELLPARKRTREWQAAGSRSAQTEMDSDSTAMEGEEEDQEDEETRSPASKR
jgi:hypothetical protein